MWRWSAENALSRNPWVRDLPEDYAMFEFRAMPWLVRTFAAFYLLPAGYIVFWAMQSLPPEPSTIDWFAAIWSLAGIAAPIFVWVFLGVRASRKDLWASPTQTRAARG